MDEYIRRQSVFDALSTVDEDKQISLYGAVADFMVMVSSIPTADVAPIIHGHWELASDGDGAVCSHCREDFCNLIHETDKFKFCPNCGARMDGGADDA